MDHPDGVQVKAIRDGLEFDLPPRMLQRRLALLVEQKLMVPKSKFTSPYHPKGMPLSAQFVNLFRSEIQQDISGLSWMNTGPTIPSIYPRKHDSIAVGIAESVYHPLEVPQLIDECFQQILDTTAAINDPFEQAFFAMVHLPYLQPFEDVNKRVPRLAANLSLIRENLSPCLMTYSRISRSTNLTLRAAETVARLQKRWVEENGTQRKEEDYATKLNEVKDKNETTITALEEKGKDLKWDIKNIEVELGILELKRMRH